MNVALMQSQKLTRELEALKEEQAALRSEVEKVEATSTELEQALDEAKDRLVLTRQAIADREKALAEKHDQLRRAQLEEALQRREEAAARLAEVISQVLVELEAHEAAEQAVSTLEGHPARLREQPDGLAEPWERLKEAVRQRSDIEFADELVEAAARSRMPDAMDALPAHLREAALTRVQARKRERQGQAHNAKS
jgi:chromosome segregation ATPase